MSSDVGSTHWVHRNKLCELCWLSWASCQLSWVKVLFRLFGVAPNTRSSVSVELMAEQVWLNCTTSCFQLQTLLTWSRVTVLTYWVLGRRLSELAKTGWQSLVKHGIVRSSWRSTTTMQKCKLVNCLIDQSRGENLPAGAAYSHSQLSHQVDHCFNHV